MIEGDLKGELTKKLRTELPIGFRVYRHEDRRTSGVPDISITGCKRTTWLEVKFINPRLEDFELQHIEMQRLAIAGQAWYVIYELRRDVERTLIVEPKHLENWQSQYVVFHTGFKHRLIVDFIRKVHLP